MPTSVLSHLKNLFLPQVRGLMPYYILVLAVTIFYGNVTDNDFLYDDKYLILKNTYLQSWHSVGDIFRTYVNSGAFRNGHFYRPLQNIIYLLIYQAVGPSLFAFHLLNVALHAINACLVYALGRKLSFSPWAVFFAALLWALHPLNTEAVTYMSATADVLYVFFCLLGLIILLPDFTPKKILAVTPLFLLGLLSKESAIVFPLLVMSCMYLVSNRRLDLKTYLRTWPLWAVVIGYLAVRFYALPFSSTDLLNTDAVSKYYGTHISARIYTFLATIPSYISLMLWPSGLHMDRDFATLLEPWHWQLFAGVLFLIAAGAQIIWGRGKRSLPLSWGLMWFAASHLPQTGILVPVNSLFLEHWMYLPMAGLMLGVAETIVTYIRQPEMARISAVVASIIAVIFGCLTYQQNTVWNNPVAFYHNILDHGETSVRARNNLGIAYMNRGQYKEAMEQFQLALKDHDLTPETHQNIAALLSKNPDGQSHTHREINELQSALAIDPEFAPACDGLADIYEYQGDKEKAAFYRKRAEMSRKKFKPQ